MAFLVFCIGGAFAGGLLAWVVALLLRVWGLPNPWVALSITVALIAAALFIPDYSDRDNWLVMLTNAGNQIAVMLAATAAAAPVAFWINSPPKP